MEASNSQHATATIPNLAIRLQDSFDQEHDQLIVAEAVETDLFVPRELHRSSTLSLRITDLIDEAFPLTPSNTLEEPGPILCENLSSFDLHFPPSPSSSIEGVPPQYTDDSPPEYRRHRTLAEHLADPTEVGAFAVPIKFQRVAMDLPIRNQPLMTKHELMLVWPQMDFGRFLQLSCTAAVDYIVAQRQISRRLLPGEKITVSLQLKIKSKRKLRRRKRTKMAITESNWAAVMTLLQDRPKEVKFKVKFWTEFPGS